LNISAPSKSVLLHEGQIDVRYPVDDLTNSLILGQTRLGSGHLRVGYVFLPLLSLRADDQIVSRPMTFSPMTATVGSRAYREALHPGAMQHVRQLAKLSKKQGSLFQEISHGSV